MRGDFSDPSFILAEVAGLGFLASNDTSQLDDIVSPDAFFALEPSIFFHVAVPPLIRPAPPPAPPPATCRDEPRSEPIRPACQAPPAVCERFRSMPSGLIGCEPWTPVPKLPLSRSAADCALPLPPRSRMLAVVATVDDAVRRRCSDSSSSDASRCVRRRPLPPLTRPLSRKTMFGCRLESCVWLRLFSVARRSRCSPSVDALNSPSPVESELPRGTRLRSASKLKPRCMSFTLTSSSSSSSSIEMRSIGGGPSTVAVVRGDG
mmetsp:Transcript_9467/g.25192  ORF Transcript_9467/g.25192 Transcript_9467/m.25192 type:complete len:263 (-) Transcript_9467:877-1665(-)